MWGCSFSYSSTKTCDTHVDSATSSFDVIGRRCFIFNDVTSGKTSRSTSSPAASSTLTTRRPCAVLDNKPVRHSRRQELFTYSIFRKVCSEYTPASFGVLTTFTVTLLQMSCCGGTTSYIAYGIVLAVSLQRHTHTVSELASSLAKGHVRGTSTFDLEVPAIHCIV